MRFWRCSWGGILSLLLCGCGKSPLLTREGFEGMVRYQVAVTGGGSGDLVELDYPEVPVGDQVESGKEVLRLLAPSGREVALQVDPVTPGESKKRVVRFLLPAGAALTGWSGDLYYGRGEKRPLAQRVAAFLNQVQVKVSEVTRVVLESEQMGYFSYGPLTIDLVGKTTPPLVTQRMFEPPGEGPHHWEPEVGALDFMPVGLTPGAGSPFVTEEAEKPAEDMIQPWTGNAFQMPPDLPPAALTQVTSRLGFSGPLVAEAVSETSWVKGRLASYIFQQRMRVVAGRRELRVELAVRELEKSGRARLGWALRNVPAGERKILKSSGYVAVFARELKDGINPQPMCRSVGFAFVVDSSQVERIVTSIREDVPHVVLFRQGYGTVARPVTVWVVGAWDRDGAASSPEGFEKLVREIHADLERQKAIRVTVHRVSPG